MSRFRVGCIGLGIMGRPMSLNLLRAGHELHVWARRPEVLDEFRQAGAQVADSIAELTGRIDVLVTNVSDTGDVEAILLGEAGVLQHARPGLVVIDHSTISPTRTRVMAQALAAASVDMLDAPVSGGEAGAIAGTLTVMVGGKAEVLARVRPVLECVGSTITHVGEHGAGQLAKACNQLIVAQTMNAVAEAISLAEAAGVDAWAVREALLGGSAYSRVLEIHAQKMLRREYVPGFRTALHAKDMGIVLDTARELGLPLPATALTAQWLHAAAARGHGDADSTVIAEMQRRLMPG